MSKVHSFRLSDDNPREAQAKQILKSWTSQGYTLRYLITEALLCFNSGDKKNIELADTLEQIFKILNDIENIQSHTTSVPKNEMHLTRNFMESIQKRAQSGVKYLGNK